jgi:cardiolipin synthase
MKDLEAAEHSVNINIFGLMGDSWGKEVFDLLIDKAQKGVKVRVMADALGARMHWYFGNKNEEFLQHLRDNGIEVIITSDEPSSGNFHFDHRKCFIIDGKLAHNTGYTIEEHMRNIHFDMGMRVEGDMVNQMQASFFTSWMHWGGKIEEASTEQGYDQFISEYFPKAGPLSGTTEARLLLNIPRVQHRATEVYYDAISGAKEKISVINEFLSDNELMDRLYEKAKAGVEIEIVFPRECEWEGYKFIAYDFFDKLKQFPNVKAYLYDGPQDTGWLHTKGIAIDGNYINFGSTNMDELSLYHNYEQNIETKDPAVVKAVQEKIFDYAIANSKLYNEEPSWGRTIKTYFYKIFKKVIEP